MVYIGISGAASAACPRDCSECQSCRHPMAELRLVSAAIEERDETDPFSAWYMVAPVKRTYYVSTLVCSKCGATTRRERQVGKP